MKMVRSHQWSHGADQRRCLGQAVGRGADFQVWDDLMSWVIWSKSVFTDLVQVLFITIHRLIFNSGRPCMFGWLRKRRSPGNIRPAGFYDQTWGSWHSSTWCFVDGEGFGTAKRITGDTEMYFSPGDGPSYAEIDLLQPTKPHFLLLQTCRLLKGISSLMGNCSQNEQVKKKMLLPILINFVG